MFSDSQGKTRGPDARAVLHNRWLRTMDLIETELGEFWDLVTQVWQTTAFGINVGHLLTALGIFLVFWILRSLFANTVIRYLSRWVERTETVLDDHIFDAIRDPLTFIPVILGLFLAFNALGLEGVYQTMADNIIRSMVAYTIFWALYRAVDPLTAALENIKKVFTPTLMDWTRRGVKALFVFMGAATILELWGIQVGPILAGLGLFGVALALGAQDLFKNLIAGFLVIIERRFQRGDWILVDGVVEGTVERINFRSTMVRRFDKAPVYVPNSQLSDNAVTNFSAMTHRRIYWKIGVEYRTSVDQLRAIRDGIELYVLGNDDFAHPPEVSTFVRIDAFSDSSIDIMLYCFTRTTNWGEWLAIKETLAYKIKDIVEGAGSSFAFPSQSLYVESLPGTAPELYSPPDTAGAE